MKKHIYAKRLLLNDRSCQNCGLLKIRHKDSLAYNFFGEYDCEAGYHNRGLPPDHVCSQWGVRVDH